MTNNYDDSGLTILDRVLFYLLISTITICIALLIGICSMRCPFNAGNSTLGASGSYCCESYNIIDYISGKEIKSNL